MADDCLAPLIKIKKEIDGGIAEEDVKKEVLLSLEEELTITSEYVEEEEETEGYQLIEGHQRHKLEPALSQTAETDHTQLKKEIEDLQQQLGQQGGQGIEELNHAKNMPLNKVEEPQDEEPEITAMSHSLVRFVGDGLYHVCPSSQVEPDPHEVALCSAIYMGMSFRAVVIASGDKKEMDDIKSRCQLSDYMVKNYKISTPSPSEFTTTSTLGDPGYNVKRNPFQTAEESTLTHLENVVPTFLTPANLEGIQKPSDESSPQNTATGELQGNITEPERLQIQQSCHRPSIIEEAKSEQKMVVDVTEEDLDSETSTTTKKKKQYYCPFCRTLYKKLARHLFQVHKKEENVKAISSLTKNDPERRRVLSLLRAKGSRMFNNIQTSPNRLILPRNKSTFKIEEYIPCHLCGNTYKSKYLYRHVKICPNTDGNFKQAKRTAIQHLYKTDEENDQAIKFSQHVLSGMREGEVKTTIEKDPLLRSVGKFWCTQYGPHTHLVNLIRRKLRQVTEILLQMKKDDSEITSFSSVFEARKKQTLFEAVKKVCGFQKNTFLRPAMANELQALLKTCATRLIVMSQEKNDEEGVRKVRQWMEIFKEGFSAYIGRHARRTLDKNKWNKTKTSPSSQDKIKMK